MAEACAAIPLLCVMIRHRLHPAAGLHPDLLLLSAMAAGLRDDKVRRLLAVWTSRRLGRGMWKAEHGRPQPAEQAGCASGNNILGSSLQARCSIDQVAIGRHRGYETSRTTIVYLLCIWQTTTGRAGTKLCLLPVTARW